MLTLITGAPGAGKTAALVDLLREITDKGRVIYVDGIPDLTLPHQVLGDARQWMTAVPDGAAVVIDEVQRVWRPAAAGSRVPPDIEALETHRHRGLDFFLVTQHPNLLHANVRRLVGRHVHLRDVGMLGRWWYEWPEVTDPAQFRNAPIKKSYKLPKSSFGLYKSASLHVKPIRSVPRAALVAVAAGVGCIGLGWYAWQSISARSKPSDQASLTVKAPGSAASAPGAFGQAGAAPASPVGNPLQAVYQVTPAVVQREPYAGFRVHFAGSYFTDRPGQMFTLSLDGRAVASVTGDQLRDAGYIVRLVAPCVAVLSFNGRERVAACDVPYVPPRQDDRRRDSPKAPDSPGGGIGGGAPDGEPIV